MLMRTSFVVVLTSVIALAGAVVGYLAFGGAGNARFWLATVAGALAGFFMAGALVDVRRRWRANRRPPLTRA